MKTAHPLQIQHPKGGIVLVVAVLALVSQASVSADGADIPHEYVPDLRENESLDGVGGDVPSAFVYDGEILAAPDLESPSVRDDAPTMAAPPGNGMGREELGRRSPSFRPDRITQLEQDVDYHVVFAPSVMPHKRVTALDRVELASDGVPVLTSSVTGAELVEVGAAPPPGQRDRFWGHVKLDFRGGDRVPLPSVSPESGILSIETSPPVALRFERDDAGNYHVIAEEETREAVQLAFLMDAPVGYWNRSLPDDDVVNAPVGVNRERVPPMPAGVRERALEFARELELSPESSYRRALDVLTRHFRSFRESREQFGDGEDIYLDLARGMLGVCRHRAYAFVITAQALGMPARFVMNEAHAFVEVLLPDQAWMRVDLGGAAVGVRTRGDADAPRYQPRHRDPLPQPPSYRASLRRAGLENDGDFEPSGDENSPSGPMSPAEADGGDGSGQSSGARSESARDGTGSRSGPPGESATGVDSGEASSSGSTSDGRSSREGDSSRSSRTAVAAREPIRVSLAPTRNEVLRGESLDVSGRIESAASESADGVDGMRVEVLLSGRTERLLGVMVTDEVGRFTGTFGVPHDLAVGDYRLVVRTPGDTRHLPAEAQ